MNIEISGVYPANRGALLMLEAIRARIMDAFPDAKLAVPLDWTGADRLRYGVWGTRGSQTNNLSLRVLERAPWKFRDRATFVRSDEIDVLLDASGFGYGDFWGINKLQQRLSNRLDVWKKGRKKAILLPQALGPFETPNIAHEFRRAAEQLDLIYVRDAASLAYVEKILPNGFPVRRAPDFTNLLDPDLPKRLSHLRGASYVIPNEKIVTGKGDATLSRYITFLMDSIGALRESGRDPAILLHEGRNDVRLAEAVNARLDRPAPIVDEPDALVTKAVIGAADLIISSRFHGLVSALSAGVPAMACGWSHKYRELMVDYGCEDAIVDLVNTEKSKEEILGFLEKAGDPTFRDDIAAKANREKSKSLAMWDEVLACLRQ